VNQELLHLIEQISREKGVEKSVVIDAVLAAVLSAARKRFGTIDNIHTRLDEETGVIALFSYVYQTRICRGSSPDCSHECADKSR